MARSTEAEVVEAEYRESDEFEFRADIRVRLHNPDGRDVIAVRTYKARPKHDELVSDEDRVQEFTAYWWPDAFPSDGDSSFADADADWEPVAELNDDEALLEECVENATYDAAAELDGLKDRSDRIRQKLDSAAVCVGDELAVDDNADGQRWEITSIDRVQGMVNVRRIDDGRRDANDRDSWPIEEAERFASED